MRIAVAGKGGAGKTTISGILARLYARDGKRVLAIDGDSNPNLGVTLGLQLDQSSSIAPLPGNLLQMQTDAQGNRVAVLARAVGEIVNEYAVPTSDGVRLLVASRIEHAGTG